MPLSLRRHDPPAKTRQPRTPFARTSRTPAVIAGAPTNADAPANTKESTRRLYERSLAGADDYFRGDPVWPQRKALLRRSSLPGRRAGAPLDAPPGRAARSSG